MKKNSLWVLLERFQERDPAMFRALFKHVIIGELRRHGVSTVDLVFRIESGGALWMKADYWPSYFIFKDGPVAFLSLLGELKVGDPDIFWAAVAETPKKEE